MGKANDLVDGLMARPHTQRELEEREQAAKPQPNLVATLDGQLVEPGPTPTVVTQAPQQTWD